MNKIKLLSLFTFAASFFLNDVAYAQDTLTLGTGTSSSSTRGPFQRSDTNSSSVYSRAIMLFSAAELSSAGIVAGKSITELQWEKGNSNVIIGSGNANLKVYIKNSSATALVSDSWTNFTTGSSLVLDKDYNTTDNFPSSSGWMPFVLDVPFTYTGGAIEIAVDWDCSALSGNRFSGNGSVTWRWQSTTFNSLANRTGSSSAPSTISTIKSERANTRIVHISAGPVCDPPSLLYASTTETTANLSWVASASATQYNWKVVAAGAGSSATAIASGTSMTTSAVASGLSDLTSYDFYVQSDCGADSSGYAGPFSFLTKSSIAPDTLTIGSGTSSSSTRGPLQRSDTNSSTVYSRWVQIFTASELATAGLTSGSALSALNWELASSNVIIGSGDANLKIYVKNSSATAAVSDSWTNYISGSSLVFDQDFNTTNNFPGSQGWMSFDFNQSFVYTGGSIEVAVDWDNSSLSTPAFSGDGSLKWRWTSTAPDNLVAKKTSSSSPSSTISDLRDERANIQIVSIKPPCFDPTAPSASAVNATDATIHWTENGTATEWEVEYGTTGFTLGTGTVVQVLTDTFTTLTGLTASTAYDWYVRAVCGPADSSAWTSISSFTTTAVPFAVPYSQDFEGASPLTDFTTSVGSDAGLFLDAGSNCAATNSLHMTGGSASGWSGGSTSTTVTQAWVTNTTKQSSASVFVDATGVTASGMELSFDLKQQWSYGPGYSWARIMVNGTQISPDYQPATQNADPCTNHILDLTAYIGTSFDLSFEFSGKYDNARGNSGNGDNAFFDNIQISPVTCPDPSNLAASAITATTADLTWVENGTATTWNVEYGAQGFTPGTGTASAVTNTTLSVTGLTTYTSYDFYVQSDCGADSSRLIGPFTFTVGGPLAGSYTIDSAIATGGTNFESFSVLATAINSFGVSAAVDVSVAANTYNDQFSLGEIAGASMTNTILIDGNGAATLTHDKSIRNSTITLEGSSWLTVKNMTIAATGGLDSWGIHLFDSAHHITIDSNVIQLPVGTTGDVAGIIGSNSETSDAGQGDNAHDIIISNNTITGGERGVSLYGSFTASARNSGMTIMNNTFTNNDDNGIYLTGYDNVTVTGNTVNTPNNSGSDAMYSSDLENFTISGNYFSGNDFGLDMDDSNFDNNVPAYSTISNNMIIGGDDALSLDDVDSVNVFHNSLYAADWALILNDDSNLDIRNNILYSVDDHALNSDDGIVHVMDNNIFFTGGTADLVEFGTSDYADLAAFQAGEPTMNINSLQGDPTFINPGVDLHVSGALANDVGDNSVGITVDFDGDMRPLAPSTTVDIGADEFVPPSCLTPSANAASSITSDSAMVSWVENGTAMAWEVEYGVAGFTQGTGTVVMTTDTFITINGLSPVTTYDWYVRADCGLGSFSTWSPAASFITPCGAITSPATLPFVEDWESSTGTQSGSGDIACDTSYSWSFVSDQPVGRVRFGTDAVLASTGAGAVTLDVDPSGTLTVNDLILTIDLSAYSAATNLELLFDFAHHGEEPHDNDSVWVRGASTDAWVGIYDLYANRGTGGVYNSVAAIDIDAALAAASQTVSSTFQVRFGQEDNFPATSPTISDGFSFDNIIIRETPLTPIALPITWDATTVDYTTIDFGGNASMLTADPTNATNTVLQSIKGAGAQIWAGTSFGDSLASAIPFATGTTTIRAVVYSPTSGTPVRLKVEDHTNPAISVETEVMTSVAGAWDTLSFDFSMQVANTPAVNFANTYDKMSIFYNFGTMPTVADTFYVDYVEDVTMNSVPPTPSKLPIALPITWDDTANVNYTTIDFGGNASMSTADPVNATNIVLQSIKGAGAQVWAGTSFGDSLAAPIPFSTGNTTIRAVVYSPITGIEVRLKVEDQANGAISVESVDTTTVIGWDTLNFDMSMHFAGTPAINFANKYNKMSIFYNFGVMPATADTFYVDYVAFENPPVIAPGLPYYSIGTINTEDASGVADSLNVNCAISGTVVGVNRRSTGYEFTVIDMSSGSQEGITVFDFNGVPSYTSVTEGDSLYIEGDVSQFRGLIQFSPDSFNVISTGNSIPAPIVVVDLDESTESKWLSIPTSFVALANSTTGSFNLEISNGTDTLIMRIDADTDVDDSLATTGNMITMGDTICGLFGIGGQFSNPNAAPFDNGYQIFPMRWSDITICRLAVGIEDVEVDQAQFVLVPNPSNGEFEIRTNGFNHSTVNVVIRDMSGRVVYNEFINNANNTFNKSFDLNGEAKGVYFITIADGEDVINEKLIIK